MKANSILGFLLSILIGLFVFFVGVEVQSDSIPNQVFKVYLNNQVLGMIDSEEELLTLINLRQQEVKEKYRVDEVHPPRGLEIKKAFTFKPERKTAEEIYDLIQDDDPFTIGGYIVTLQYPTEEDGDVKETHQINVLRKTDFEEAFRTVVKAFVGSSQYELFIEDNQPAIITTGSIIESIYWEENITIRRGFLDVGSQILTNAGEISKYLFFGTIEDQKHYTIREGDDIESIAASHNLHPDEFLVANPEFTSKNVLLTPGQLVNIGLIDPLVSIVSEVHLVEDVVTTYQTRYVNDPNAWFGTRKTTQEGEDGLHRVTEKVKYRNGEIISLVIVGSEEIEPTIDRIISRGTRLTGGGWGTYENVRGNQDWSWPTLSPFIISSRYGPRWGRFHRAIDITGTGWGSPIRAVQSGKVIVNEWGGSYGWYIVIDHENGYFTMYAHLARKPNLKIGESVKREQIIGHMGSTGFTTGVHLHFEVIQSSFFGHNAPRINPCTTIFRC